MLKFFLTLFVSIPVSADNNLFLLESIKNNEDWVLIDIRSDSIRVYDNSGTAHYYIVKDKVEKIIDSNAEFIFKTIMDINQYSSFMPDDDFKSFIVGQKENWIYAYSQFSIPFTFIDNRHYIFKTQKVSNNEINWILLNEKEAKSNLDLRVIMNKNSGAIYLDYAAGVWRVEPVTENLTQVSYALYMDSGGLITDNLNDLFSSQFIIKFYKQIMKHSNN